MRGRIGWKDMGYYWLYRFNRMRYKKRKVKIPFLEIWVGQCCNLKCRNCCHLIPYLPQKIYDVEQIVEDCKRVFEWCEVEFFSIVGGEPFSHPKIYRLIDFVAQCPDIEKGKIVTNGTILPRDEVVDSLKRLNGKLEIRIDGYPDIGIEAVEKFADLMKQNQIPYHYARFNPHKQSSWKQLTPDGGKPLTKSKIIPLFFHCNIRDCNTLANGELTLCPRGISSNKVFGCKKNEYENVNIRKLKDSITAKAKIATCISRWICKDYCQYCLSLSKKNSRYVKPGEQLKT